MKKIICLVALLSFCNVCYADWNTYETKKDAYDRRSYENYNQYQNNGYQNFNNGYNRPINDNGGQHYGQKHNSGFNSLNNHGSRNTLGF